MPTTTEKPLKVKLKKDKSSKKIKTESTDEQLVEVKKEKSSKKRKAEGTEAHPVEASSQPESENIPAAEPSENETTTTEPSKKKRKFSLASEIEVDISLPEPPSKKALRRLKKGKPLPPSISGADSTSEPNESTTKPEVEKRSEHGIWIGNLPWTVTKDDLRKFFVENSEITDEGITRIHMPSPDDGKPANKVEDSRGWKKQHNKGFAYVDFSTAEAATEAVELSEQLLQGRRVLIKNNKSFEGRPMKTKEESRAEGKEPSKRVFVGNLRFDTTEESLKEHFSRCGPIEHLMIATFEDSGKCKGYGWITFAELEAAEAAVRGWVKVPEEPESDFESESESDSDADSDSNSDSGSYSTAKEDAEPEEDQATNPSTKPKPAPRKAAVKKLFVDKIHARPVRREFAEPPQVRYKKRYGKDGSKARAEAGASTGIADGAAEGEVSAPHREVAPREPRPPRPVAKVEYRQAYAPRLTGGIVASKGKKVVF